MTATRTAAPSVYVSGMCVHARHDRCRGAWGTTTCDCPCHQEPDEPEPVGLRIGSLFSGYGGLEQGVQSVLGGTVAWHSEIDPGACKILSHRYPDVPNVGDITAVDWASVEPVDVLTGGFPCQDVSAAGKRLGIRPDTRSGLWTQFAYAIGQLRPSLVVIENVRGLLSASAHSDLEPCPWCVGDDERVPLRALGAVLGDLAELGYDASWHGLRAADIGAPHGRFRVFVVAWPQSGNPHGIYRDGRPTTRQPREARSTAGHGGSAADADGTARGERRFAAPGQAEGGRPRPDAGGRGGAPAAYANGDPVRQQPVTLTGCGDPTVTGHAGADAAPDADPCGRRPLVADLRAGQPDTDRGAAADTDRDGLEVVGRLHAIGRDADGRCSSHTAWGDYEPAIRRWEGVLGRTAPAPTELSVKGSPRLSPVFVEWLMGLPAGWVTDVPGLTRNEQLKALGNGVVWQQAAAALRMLLPDMRAEDAA